MSGLMQMCEVAMPSDLSVNVCPQKLFRATEILSGKNDRRQIQRTDKIAIRPSHSALVLQRLWRNVRFAWSEEHTHRQEILAWTNQLGKEPVIHPVAMQFACTPPKE